MARSASTMTLRLLTPTGYSSETACDSVHLTQRDSVAGTGGGLVGIRADHAVNYHADHKGTAVIYEAMSEAVCSVRACKPMSTDWKRKVDADYKKRGRK